MTTSPVETLAAVEKMIGDLLSDIGANVCVTCRGRNQWTISGKPGQVKKAVAYQWEGGPEWHEAHEQKASEK